jgi:hypothetical protein
VTDHYAVSDEHALSIARSIVANLNWTEGTKTFVSSAPNCCVCCCSVHAVGFVTTVLVG